MSPLWEARKKEKTKKTHFVKCGFFVVCPYGPLCHPCGRQGRRKNEKTTLCKMCFFRGLPIRASMSPLWEARKEETWFFRGLPIQASMSPLWKPRKEEKTKKPHFVKRGFFVVCPYGPPCHPFSGKKEGKNAKTTLCKTWFFRGLPIRASMSPLWEARKEEKRKNHTL